MKTALFARTSLRGALALVLAAFLSGPSAAAAQDAAQPQGDSLLADVEALLTHLRQGGALADVSQAERKAVLQALLRELGYAEFRRSAAPAEESGEDDEAPAVSQRVVSLNDWCVLLLLTRLDSDTAAALAEDLQGEGDSGGEKPWIVLDLRWAGDGTDGGVDALLETLDSGRKPVMVLVGEQTGAAARGLLGRLRKQGVAVSLGKQGGYAPAETMKLRLPSGLSLTVPDFSGNASAAAPETKPDIRVKTSGNQLPSGALNRDDATLQRMLLRDPTVRRALDTLVAVRAFAKPHF